MPFKTPETALLHAYEERKIKSFVWSRSRYEEAITNEDITKFWHRMLKSGYLVLVTRERKLQVAAREYKPRPAIYSNELYYWRKVLGLPNYYMDEEFLKELDEINELKEAGFETEVLGTGDPDRLKRIKAIHQRHKPKRQKRVSRDTRRIVEEGLREKVQSKIAEFMHGPAGEEETHEVKKGMCFCKVGGKITKVLKVTKLPPMYDPEFPRYE